MHDYTAESRLKPWLEERAQERFNRKATRWAVIVFASAYIGFMLGHILAYLLIFS